MLSNLGWRSLEHAVMTPDSLCFQDIPWHCCSACAVILRVSLVICTNLVSARYMFLLTITGIPFFPMRLILWNGLPSSIVVLGDLDSFKREVSKIKYSRPYIVTFGLFFFIFLAHYHTNFLTRSRFYYYLTLLSPTIYLFL